jgi:signal transduction histidine kinase
VPLTAALVPVSRALSAALAAEHAARLDRAALAVEGELSRLGEAAAAAVTELAGSAEAESFARELASGTLGPAVAQDQAGAWMAQRGLDVLAVVDGDGRVISSGHLPGRAGDLDPDARWLVRENAPGRAVAALVPRASPEGVAPVLAEVAWAALPGPGGLRLTGGQALGAGRAARLAELTGGEIRVEAGGETLALSEAVAPGLSPLAARLQALLGGARLASRTVLLGPPGAAVGRVEVRMASAGLFRAQLLVLGAFILALVAGSVAAALAGAALARRITRPLEALRGAAARVAAGELGAQVGVRAEGEVGELVAAFDAMSAQLATGRTRLAQAERIAAWREVARRLAHEIKNPLTPIAMSVETLRDARSGGRPDFDEIFEESTRAIGEEVRRLKRIVDEFGRFARLPPPQRTPAPPEELVQAVLALFPAPPEGVHFRREVAPGLSPVLADRDQILQVLLNLVRNALDAMAGAGGTITLAARPEGDRVALTVTDTGPGIPAQDRARLFEPYFTTKPGGTGLGLAIARRIAEEHGGTLQAEPGAGPGAAFTLWLPVVSAQAGAPAPAAAQG